MLNFLWFALGLSALVVALALAALVRRLIRVLGVLEENLNLVEDALHDVVPEIRATLGNVNDISAGVNVAVRGASRGAARLTAAVDSGVGGVSRRVRAAAHGARVGVQSVLTPRGADEEGGDGDVER